MSLKLSLSYGKKIAQKICILGVGLIFFALPLNGADVIHNPHKGGENNLPQGYKRKNVAEQIARYRHLISPVWQSLAHKEELPTQHIPGLIQVVEESVAILGDSLEKSIADIHERDEARGLLEKIWNIADGLDKNRLLSLENSTVIHFLLAYTMDFFKGYVSGLRGFEIKNDIERTIALWSEGLKKAEEENLQGKGDEFTSILSSLEMKRTYYITSPRGGGVVFILHRHPDPAVPSALSFRTFVDQYFHPDYSACLALFDVVSAPPSPGKEGTSKKDPHWGVENGVSKMLGHDCNHCENIANVRTASFIQMLGGFNLFDHLKPVYQAVQYYRNAGNKNAELVLTNGLFILFHEIIPSISFDAFDPEKNSPDDLESIKDSLSQGQVTQAILAMINAVNKHMVLSVEGKTANSGKVGTFLYKSEVRDWEHILKQGVDVNGNPFLTTLPMNLEKRRAFPAGQREGGNPYLMEKEEKDVSYLPKVPQSLKEDRYKLLMPALKDGYERFWITFSHYFEGYTQVR